MRAHPAQAGVEDEIEQLFITDGPRLWRAVLAYTGDEEFARDAVAEAFTLALEHRDGISSPSGWVWRVAFRIAAAELRRRGRRASEATLEQSEEQAEPAVELLAALQQLPPRHRGAIVLHYYADRPVKEVARILGSTPSAVRVHLMRGRRRLRELLEERDG